jgi:CMP-N,N'-diacetyllegionaminic acid synthase
MLNNNEVYAIIPARSGSKGVSNKNIINLGGYPLIAYSIAAAKKCPTIDRVIVSTDSKEYARIAIKYGAEVPFIRPSDISNDIATDLQFFKHAVQYFRQEENHVPEYFAHLRPTTPLRHPNIIDQGIKKFINSEYSALRSVHEMSETAYKNFEIENEKLKILCGGSFDIESANLPRQSLPVTYYPNGYIDIVRSSMIEKNLLHGDNVHAFITEVAYEIDEIDDIDFLEFMIQKKPNLLKKLFLKSN